MIPPTALVLTLLAATAFPTGDLEDLQPAVAALVREARAEAEASPDSAQARGRLGLVCEANNLWPEARAAFAAAARLAPDEPVWQLHEAIAMQVLGETEAALELLQQIVARSSRLAAARQRLAEALIEAGRLEEAAGHYARLVEQLPDSAEAWAGVGAVAVAQRRYGPAAEALETAVRIDPGYRAARYLLGLAYRGQGRLEDAQRELARGAGGQIRYLADEVTPRLAQYAVHLAARHQQAAGLLAAGRAGEAAELLEKTLAESPGSVETMNDLAVAYLRLGRPAEARGVLLRALELDGDRLSTHFNLIACALRLGAAREAVGFADRVVEIAPDSGRAWAARASALGAAGDYAAALGAAQRAAELAPQALRPLLLVGQLALLLERDGEAAAALERAERLRPGDPAVAALRRRLDERRER